MINFGEGSARQEPYEAALRWANEIRASQGREPLDDLPRGVREHSTACPLHCATGLEMSRLGLKRARVTLPEQVRLWGRWFDAGEYPELEE